MTADGYRAKLDALRDGSLDPAGFGHRDHIGVACELLRHHEFFAATAIMAAGLRALTERAGVPEKYNATITFASMSLIAERMRQDDFADAADFVRRNADRLDLAFLTRQYPPERLHTPLARAVPLLPGDQFARMPA
ncbi:MAG: hypothetical protein D6754_00470 [Alphaproteobacteria bacterium]|nr:MAG: hypothetical protein D6754_00470 [Alphaproteobacteria bacterium]